MAEKRPALGRGLSALIVDAPPHAPAPGAPGRDHPLELDIDLLSPNPLQPRTTMNDVKLEELTQSIRTNGVIQPIVVRRAGGGRYEIVAGERRWRAAQHAGLLKVPIAIRDVPDDKLLEVALIENIQRDDLNPIEEAQAYRRMRDDLHMQQEAIASAVGKDRATVANYLRLLRLPSEVRADLASGALSMGHARAVLALDDEDAQRRVARETVARGLSVRETEALVRREASPPAPAAAPPRVDANTRAAEEQLKIALGTRVRIARKGKGGRVEIDFSSEAELQRLYEILTQGR